jgi:hypothetical protein
MSAEKHLNPSDFSDEQVERLAFAILGFLGKYGVVARPMNGKEAIAFTGRGETTFYKWVDLGIIKAFRPDPNGDPVYFADQIVEGLKEAGKTRK